ncbi:MAG: hypothetical protein GY768_11130 [Planctomycetaceae bacterium]|nr:hypothetical protein [Planctomycetaceae bacterium]
MRFGFGRSVHNHRFRLVEAAATKVGRTRLQEAFKKHTFVYGTEGTGSNIVSGLKRWAARPHRSTWELAKDGYNVQTPHHLAREARHAQRPHPPGLASLEPVHEGLALEDTRGVPWHLKPSEHTNPFNVRKVLERELNLFDPGRRANFYIDSGCQMMDFYYGKAGTYLHKKRDPVIAEFIHHAMGFAAPFSMVESGRQAYMREFNTSVEGYDNNSPSKARYNGLTATKEMSRLIRWGISTFGGTLVFEGREVYYSQVFRTNPPRIGDTDLEARELFQYFEPGASAVPFDKGRILFHWCGTQTVPTKVHFLTNWTWANNETHKPANIAKPSFARDASLLPIWDNFAALPPSLTHYNLDVIADQLSQLRPA